MHGGAPSLVRLGDLNFNLPLLAVVLNKFLAVADRVDRLVKLLDEVDGVELASRGAEAAADAAVLVHNRGAAAEAAGRLLFELLFGEGNALIASGVRLRRVDARDLSGDIVVADIVEVDIGFIQLLILSTVARQGDAVALPNRAADGDGALLAGRNGIDAEFHTGDNIAARKDIVFAGLVGQGIDFNEAALVELDVRAFQEAAPVDALTDAVEHC